MEDKKTLKPLRSLESLMKRFTENFRTLTLSLKNQQPGREFQNLPFQEDWALDKNG
jgi:hypothetical protein